MNIKVCIFDLDGTIIDSGDMIFKSIDYALSPWNIKMTNEDIEVIRTRSPNELFSGYLQTPADELKAQKRLIDFSNKYAGKSVFYDGIPELLENLYKRFTLAVWTGRDTESAIKILKRNKLDHFFKMVIGCTSVNKNKPHPEGIGLIARKFNVIPAEIIIIGDHAHDIEGARRFGCKAIHVTWSKYLIPLTEKDPRPDLSLSSVYDLQTWLIKSAIL
ncbi:MAG: hypothetical protein A2381_17880 [Bdellovibrionales bacterium RIFOXYB1_FULL_37_110]|nr:MAG: hypothetical protein A2417_08670 [Bdellovibrionales bacterium RIFOXYC1_FULL_37_79]OFZ59840.1 MAG: hypothetical protein A2381_17880 [Bdellovibrionales bacterium RIFOXYB1_FULL_37_110]OFZ65454.1 MAG: hypothetical protein A2577_18415 [Bdellovibrionales bacterium RIFOXYD1_FULL_36_51]